MTEKDLPGKRNPAKRPSSRIHRRPPKWPSMNKCAGSWKKIDILRLGPLWKNLIPMPRIICTEDSRCVWIGRPCNRPPKSTWPVSNVSFVWRKKRPRPPLIHPQLPANAPKRKRKPNPSLPCLRPDAPNRIPCWTTTSIWTATVAPFLDKPPVPATPPGSNATSAKSGVVSVVSWTKRNCPNSGFAA